MAHSSSRLSRGVFLVRTPTYALGTFIGVTALLGRASGIRAATSTRSAARLGPLINIPQTWNNCGPAAIAEVLAYWGISRTQGQVQAVLRVEGPVVGMTPYGVPTFARSVGLRTLAGVGGTEAMVKGLISAGFPVIVHQLVSLTDLVGHWRPIEAFDDRQGIFTASDPYLGPNHVIDYADFARMWAQRDYAFFVLYPASHQAALTTVLAASRWNRAAAYAKDLALVREGQLDVIPTGAPTGAAEGYRYLGMAWDAAHMGQASTARSYLKQAAGAGANQIEMRWVSAAIR
ncbi:MAG: C39 family peptidase [Chloroflexota bacterium]